MDTKDITPDNPPELPAKQKSNSSTLLPNNQRASVRSQQQSKGGAQPSSQNRPDPSRRHKTMTVTERERAHNMARARSTHSMTDGMAFPHHGSIANKGSSEEYLDGAGTPTPSEKVSRWHRDIFLVSPTTGGANQNQQQVHPRQCICNQCMAEFGTFKLYNQMLQDGKSGGGAGGAGDLVIQEESESESKGVKSSASSEGLSALKKKRSLAYRPKPKRRHSTRDTSSNTNAAASGFRLAKGDIFQLSPDTKALLETVQELRLQERSTQIGFNGFDRFGSPMFHPVPAERTSISNASKISAELNEILEEIHTPQPMAPPTKTLMLLERARHRKKAAMHGRDSDLASTDDGVTSGTSIYGGPMSAATALTTLDSPDPCPINGCPLNPDMTTSVRLDFAPKLENDKLH